jgi:hypothetical protein
MEKSYPAYRTGKNIQIKMAQQMGIIECNFNHLLRTFGRPNYNRDNGDEFDGLEWCAWHIQFESGELVRITDSRQFGNMENDYTKCNQWKVNTRSEKAYEWIKQAIRDSNPNG